MANAKITDLTAATDPVSADVLAIVVDTGGTPTTKKVTWTNLFKLHATLASPTFTSVPAAPTAAAGTSTTQLATTSFVQTSQETDQNILSNQVFG